MGYTTRFDGVLKFGTEMKGADFAYLKSFFGEDIREHPEWKVSDYDFGPYIDLELSADFSGIHWSGAEKTYGMVAMVNWIVERMYLDRGVNLGLTGEMLAQGEDPDDRWRLVMKNGRAIKVAFPRIGSKVMCPRCQESFTLELSQPEKERE